jgi:opacity protein-like surface antigen
MRPGSRLAIAGFTSALLLLLPTTASADLTAFLGVNGTPTNRTARGLAAGVGLLVVGFEFEYAHTGEDLDTLAPELRTYMFNGLVQTPFPIAGMQFYGTVGGGAYQESLLGASDTNFGINYGGGVKLSLIGPLRLRLDYRVMSLQGSPLYDKPKRFYAGLNLKF